MILEVEAIIKDEVLHPIVQLRLHQPQVGIVLSICVGKEDYDLIVTIQSLPVVLRVLL